MPADQPNCDDHPDRPAAVVTDGGEARCEHCQLQAVLYGETTTDAPRPRCPRVFEDGSRCESARVHQRVAVRSGDAEGSIWFCKTCGHDFDRPYRKPEQRTLATDGGRELSPVDQHSDESLAFRETWQCSDDLYDELREWAIGHLEANTDWGERVNLSEIQLRAFFFEDGVVHFDATHPHVTHEDEYDGEFATDGGADVASGYEVVELDRSPDVLDDGDPCDRCDARRIAGEASWLVEYANGGIKEVCSACESELEVGAIDEPDLATDGGVSINAAELEARKQAKSVTPANQRKRCPECGSINVSRKTGKWGTDSIERGQWYCSHRDCLAHFDEPVTGGAP